MLTELVILGGIARYAKSRRSKSPPPKELDEHDRAKNDGLSASKSPDIEISYDDQKKA